MSHHPTTILPRLVAKPEPQRVSGDSARCSPSIAAARPLTRCALYRQLLSTGQRIGARPGSTGYTARRDRRPVISRNHAEFCRAAAVQAQSWETQPWCPPDPSRTSRRQAALHAVQQPGAALTACSRTYVPPCLGGNWLGANDRSAPALSDGPCHRRGGDRPPSDFWLGVENLAGTGSAPMRLTLPPSRPSTPTACTWSLILPSGTTGGAPKRHRDDAPAVLP